MKEQERNVLLVAQALESLVRPRQGGYLSGPRLASKTEGCMTATFATYRTVNPGRIGSSPYGGTFSFRIRGGLEEADRLFSARRVFALAESLGSIQSLAVVACFCNSPQYASRRAYQPWNH
jgi:cystathionine beta-lyase/cystathionine gamma-synthase